MLLTYVDDEEVQPAPGVGEVFSEAVRHPFQQHLQDEDVGEDFVCKLQHNLDCFFLLNVGIFKGLDAELNRLKHNYKCTFSSQNILPFGNATNVYIKANYIN